MSKIFDATHTQLFQYNRRNDYRKAISKKLTFSANANVAYGQFKVTLSSEIYTREIEVENDSHVAVGSEEKDTEVVLECHGGFRVVASVGEGHENKKKQNKPSIFPSVFISSAEICKSEAATTMTARVDNRGRGLICARTDAQASALSVPSSRRHLDILKWR